LQHQLEGQERDANDAISVWENKAEELESELEEMEEQLKKVKEKLSVNDSDDSSLINAVDELQTENQNLKAAQEGYKTETTIQLALIESLERQASNKDSELNQLQLRFDELDERRKALTSEAASNAQKLEVLEAYVEDLKTKHAESMAMIQSLQDERNDLNHQLQSRSTKTLEDERDRLTVVIKELEVELQQANEMVQACITDQSTERTTEAVAEALRDEIDMLRNQLNTTQLRLHNESSQLELSELENSRLRDDLAALVSLSNQENTPTDLKSLTTKAIDKVQAKERSEIEELRKSLVRALNDLEISQNSQKEANDAVGKAELRLKGTNGWLVPFVCCNIFDVFC
jgi:FtsZ-binding cell division protein ZapB